jgi:peptidoglycan/LPS O-acetylase OafA/YrhL
MNFSRLSTPQRISAVSILVVALAAFLPWVSIFGVGVSGIQGDGVITLVLAIAGGVVLVLTTGVLGQPKVAGKKSQIALLVLAVLVALIGLLDMNGAAAIGLYLTLFGGVAWVVGAAWQLSVGKNDGAAAEESSALR